MLKVPFLKIIINVNKIMKSKNVFLEFRICFNYIKLMAPFIIDFLSVSCNCLRYTSHFLHLGSPHSVSYYFLTVVGPHFEKCGYTTFNIFFHWWVHLVLHSTAGWLLEFTSVTLGVTRLISFHLWIRNTVNYTIPPYMWVRYFVRNVGLPQIRLFWGKYRTGWTT